jgi:formiminoglutamate deiminase
VTFWCEAAVIDGQLHEGVRIGVGPGGRISAVDADETPDPADVRLGLVVPGMANAHSHAFHRVLRGRTHADGGDFWRWRDTMYEVASGLTPESYLELATAVFAEMLTAGWTSVGEFHYVHHRPGGAAYEPAHAMELALARAATTVGIRLTLLDTLYLRGGRGVPLLPEQERFGDGSAEIWLDRWHDLRGVLAAEFGDAVVLGAAVHSVRAVDRTALATVAASLPARIPLHVHLSEQPRENVEALAEHGVTPTGLLAATGLLSERLSVVHATHLTADDVRLLGEAGTTAVFCPTTEADLGDGIGPARELADAGSQIALGSDQNAVVDPFLEARGLEAGERLASGRRGCFSPDELWRALGPSGQRSLGQDPAALHVGDACDLVELDPSSVRLAGADPRQAPFAATASDVRRVVVGGRVVAHSGLLLDGPDGRRAVPAAALLQTALHSTSLDHTSRSETRA